MCSLKAEIISRLQASLSDESDRILPWPV
jgi:hypothetical protein